MKFNQFPAFKGHKKNTIIDIELILIILTERYLLCTCTKLELDGPICFKNIIDDCFESLCPR